MKGLHYICIPDSSNERTHAPRGSCTAPQEKSETAQSTKGRCNAGGATRKKPSFLPSYRELIRAHYRTGEHDDCLPSLTLAF